MASITSRGGGNIEILSSPIPETTKNLTQRQKTSTVSSSGTMMMTTVAPSLPKPNKAHRNPCALYFPNYEYHPDGD